MVAADGVELKRLPPDLTPKVEVIQQRVVEKGDRGHAGIRVTEKTWSTGGGVRNRNHPDPEGHSGPFGRTKKDSDDHRSTAKIDHLLYVVIRDH